MKICRNCQEEFQDRVNKCIYCGRPLEIVSTPQQSNLDEPDGKEKSDASSTEWQIKLKKIWDTYRTGIILIIFIIAFILLTVLQKADFQKSAKQVTGTEPPKVEAPAAPAPESAPAPTPETAVAPTSAIDGSNNAASMCYGGKCTDIQKAYELYNNAISLCSEGKCTDPQKAIEYLTEAIRLLPNFANAYCARGNVYGDLKQYQQALEDYNKAIILKPDKSIFFNNRGNVYKDLNQYQRAVEDYNEAIRLTPNDATAYHNRGNAYFIQGNKEKGCPDAQKACELGVCKLSEFAKEKGFCR